MNFLKNLGKIALYVIGAAILLIVCDSIYEKIYETIFVNISALRAQTLLIPTTPSSKLPLHVTITLDGDTAIFHKGTPSYNELIKLLQNCHSDEAIARAGNIPSYGGARCGGMHIVSYGIPSHFTFLRSRENPNYLWIGIPKPNGTALIFLAVNNDLADLVKKNQVH